MTAVLRAFGLLVAVLVIAGVVGLWYVSRSGLSAREQPGRVEEFVAERVRNLVISRHASALKNPVSEGEDAVADGRAHFADHCAICHGNDGSGNTAMGRGLWPRPPDMRLADTQQLSDGELFWIIENGIRFTGMPGWGTGTEEGELASWRLVHFIRRLPKLTPAEIEEMEALNPRSPQEIRQELEEEAFLRGKGEPSPRPPESPHKHPGGHDD